MSLIETVAVACPYCGELNDLVVDKSVPQQEYIEDCAVCCRPMVVSLRVDEQETVWLDVRREDEA
jgi:hypothetical protein